MPSRNSGERGAVVGQSAYPAFGISGAVSTSAAILPLPPFAQELDATGLPILAESGQLYVLQCTQNMNVRLVGSGTTPAAQTVTFAAASGTITLKILNWSVSITATGTNATDSLALANAVNADRILSRFFSASTNGAAITTVTYKIPGAGGNLIPFSVTGTNATAGGATLASGVGPAAGASSVNYFVTANQPFFVYRLWHHTQIDVVAAAAGTLNVHVGA